MKYKCIWNIILIDIFYCIWFMSHNWNSFFMIRLIGCYIARICILNLSQDLLIFLIFSLSLLYIVQVVSCPLINVKHLYKCKFISLILILFHFLFINVISLRLMLIFILGSIRFIYLFIHILHLSFGPKIIGRFASEGILYLCW